MLSERGDLRTGTMPVCGLQYCTSPSLPAAVKATSLGSRHSPSTEHQGSGATFNGSVPMTNSAAVLPQSTLELYDTYYASLPGTEPANGLRSTFGLRGEPSSSFVLPDALASIGPSARRLLQLDAALRSCPDEMIQSLPKTSQRGGGETVREHAVSDAPTSERTRGMPESRKRATRRTPTVPVASRTLPLYTNSSTSKTVMRASTHKALHRTEATFAASAPPGAIFASQVAATSLPSLTPDVHPPLLSSSVMNTTTGAGTTGHLAEFNTPPLVTQLQRFIRKELVLSSDGLPAPSAMEQLSPYREAFRALGTAFPAYASLMSDIQSAYDNVIQAQAELLTDAYTAVAARDVEKSAYQEQAATLHMQIDALQGDLQDMQASLEARAQAEEQERRQSVRQRPRSGRPPETLELQRELDAAQQRIGDLERNSQSDLEKIVILIGAVRECDRRLKEYERIVAGVTGQVSELDEFKRIAGEAQAELQLFKTRFADFVPMTDFELMKEYLAAELEAAQLLTRRWRRTAAVRGTQLDVMQQRLHALEEDRAALVSAAESAGGDASTALTPRPSWREIHAEFPELAGLTADVGYLTTSADRGADTAKLPKSVERDSKKFGAAFPIVKGPSATALQVRYLAQRARLLEERLLHKQQDEQQEQLRQPQLPVPQPPQPPVTSLQTVSSSTVQFADDAPDAATTAKASIIANTDGAVEPVKGRDADTTAAAAKSTLSKVNGEARPTLTMQRRTSRRGQLGHNDGLFGSPSTMQGGGGAGNNNSLVPALAPPLQLPLIGLGCGPEVPIYLRASGVLTRRPIPSSTTVSLAYHFFLEVLPTYMDQQDQQRRRGDEDARKRETDALATCFYDFLQSEVTVREELKGYDCVAHLVMNLMRDGEQQDWCSDALHVLLWTVQGLLPPRVAVDAAVVVAQVRRDVRALAKELQSSRLRRQAVSECLQPVLELKTQAELAELRAAVGGETSFNADALCTDTHPFMAVLLVQECRSSAELYVSFLCSLSARATSMAAASGGSGGPHTVTSPRARSAKSVTSTVANDLPQLAEGDRVLTLADVAAAVQEVEPQTPDVVLRELSLNAVTAAGKEELFGRPASPSTTAAASPTTQDAAAAAAGKAHSAEESRIVVRLSDMVRAIGAAPLIRRSVLNTPENCVL